MPVGVDTSDTDFDTAEETGGAKTESYTPAGSNAAVTLTAAQSGVPAHSHGLNSHTHTMNHGHGFTQPTVDGGAHAHGAGGGYFTRYAGGHSPQSYIGNGNIDVSFTDSTNEKAHTHNVYGGAVSDMSGNTGAATGNTANNTAANATESHNHTFTGTASTINHLQPYITCYMWKRTA